MFAILRRGPYPALAPASSEARPNQFLLPPPNTVPIRARSLAVVFLGLAVAAGPARAAGGHEPDPPSDREVLREFLSRPFPDSATLRRGLDALESGLEQARDGHWNEAVRLLDAAGRDLPTLGDWMPLFVAEVLAEAGDTAGVRSRLSSLDPRTGLADRWGWITTVRAFEAAGDLRGAALKAELVARLTEDRSVAAHAWLRVGQTALAAGDSIRARSAFFQVTLSNVGSTHAVHAARALSAFPHLSPAEQYRIGRTYARHGNAERAFEGLEAGLRDPALSDDVRAEVRLELGRLLFELGRYREAERRLAAFAEEPVPASMAATALLHAGRARYRSGRESEGRATLEAVAERWPGERAAAEALLILADLDHDEGRVERARERYARVVDMGLRSSDTDLAVMRLGSMAYFEGEPEYAASLFERYREGARSDVRQQASYWAGLAWQRTGDDERARERFLEAFEIDPLSYYGAEAAAHVDEALLPVGLPAGPEGTEELETELANAALRLAVHRQVPTPGSLAWEKERLERWFARHPAGLYAFAEALVDGGETVQGILLGRRILREEGEWNLRLLRIVYPFPYRETIVRESLELNLDPFFVAGLIRQESMFDAGIRSRVGAVGLMQVMPATGGELARGLGLRGFSRGDLTRPEVNVRLGTLFLSNMLERYDGRIADALIAYNAGPTRIRRWRSFPEYRDIDVFIERIPFRETRHYVKVVQENARIYAALYGCEDFRPCLGELPPAFLVERPGVGGATPAAVRR